MKKSMLIATSLLVALALLAGCAETRDPVEGGIAFHPADWAEPGSEDNHAAALDALGLPGAVDASCSGCHGADYGKPESECFFCHQTGGEVGHPDAGFVPPAGANFHGQIVIDAGGTDGCADCHAWVADDELDFDLGGWAQQSCDTCHAGGRSGHPGASVWFNPANSGFHGNAAARGMITDCAQCHGADYLGGWTGVSCDDCHGSSTVPIHFSGWVGPKTTDGTHGYLLANSEIDMDDCRACHGATFDGGWAGQTCTPCHSF